MGRLILCVASFALVTMSSVAHAGFNLCEGEGQPSGESPGSQWGAYCIGDEAAYADIQIAPHTAWGDQIGIHVTDHFDCPRGTHFQCGLETSLQQDYECLEEQSPTWDEVDGHFSWVYVWCGCYEPDEDCHS